MSLLLGLESALRGMRANTTALNTVSHNIANMNNPDYSRQLANIAATQAINNPNGGGQLGTGSTVSAIERIRNVFLDRQIRYQLENVGKWEVLDTTYQALKSLFPEVDNPAAAGIQSQLNLFFQGWEDLAAEYAKPAALRDVATAKNNLVANSKALASVLNTSATALRDMQIALTADIRTTVDNINQLTSQIAELNKLVLQARGANQRPNDLLDQREAVMKQLAELVNFEVAEKANGTVALLLNGQALVDDTRNYNLKMIAGTKNSSLESVSLAQAGGGSSAALAEVITGGKLAGLFQARDSEVAWYKTALDNLANSIVTVVNKFHKTGVDPLSGVQNDKDFFVASAKSAASIMVNLDIISNTALVNDSKYVEGDIANMIANLKNKLMNNFVTSPTTALTSASTLNSNGKLIINGIEIPFSASDTVAALLQKINQNVSGFSAVYDDTEHKIFMISNEQMTIEEVTTTGLPVIPPALINRLRLVQEQVSAGAVNYAGSSTGNLVDAAYSWKAQNSVLDWMPIKTGRVTVNFAGNKYDVSWNNTENIVTTMTKIYFFNLPSANPRLEAYYFDAAEQKFHFASGVNSSGGTNRILPFSIVDKEGNMTSAMKLIGNVRFGDYYQSMIGRLRGSADSAENILGQYENSAQQLKNVQASITRVDEEEELARAKTYQRAYDASVRLLAVIDQMMNMLINRTGSQSSSDS